MPVLKDTTISFETLTKIDAMPRPFSTDKRKLVNAEFTPGKSYFYNPIGVFDDMIPYMPNSDDLLSSILLSMLKNLPSRYWLTYRIRSSDSFDNGTSTSVPTPWFSVFPFPEYYKRQRRVCAEDKSITNSSSDWAIHYFRLQPDHVSYRAVERNPYVLDGELKVYRDDQLLATVVYSEGVIQSQNILGNNLLDINSSAIMISVKDIPEIKKGAYIFDYSIKESGHTINNSELTLEFLHSKSLGYVYKHKDFDEKPNRVATNNYDEGMKRITGAHRYYKDIEYDFPTLPHNLVYVEDNNSEYSVAYGSNKAPMDTEYDSYIKSSIFMMSFAQVFGGRGAGNEGMDVLNYNFPDAIVPFYILVPDIKGYAEVSFSEMLGLRDFLITSSQKYIAVFKPDNSQELLDLGLNPDKHYAVTLLESGSVRIQSPSFSGGDTNNGEFTLPWSLTSGKFYLATGMDDSINVFG